MQHYVKCTLTVLQICLNNLTQYLKFYLNKCLSRNTWNHFAWAFKPVLQSEHACVIANLSQKMHRFKEKWIHLSFFSFFFRVLFFVGCSWKLFFSTSAFLGLVFVSSNAFMIYVMLLMFIPKGIVCAVPRLKDSEKYMVTCFLHTLFKLKLNPVSSFSGKFCSGFVFFLFSWQQCAH